MDYELPEWLKTLIISASSGGAGILSAWAIEWYKKQKTPLEKQQDTTNQILDAAKENVSAAKENVSAAKENVLSTQVVVDLLESRLVKEREYYEQLIDRSKIDCKNEIEDMKKLYDATIDDLQAQIIGANNEKNKLSAQVDQLTLDKNELQREVNNLTVDKNALQRELNTLKVKMRQYEKKSGTGPLPPPPHELSE